MSADDYADSSPQPAKTSEDKIDWNRGSTWFLFLPEGIIAAVLIAAWPIWALTLVLKGELAIAVALVVGMSALSYCCIRALQQRWKYPAYFSMVGIIGLALVIHSWLL